MTAPSNRCESHLVSLSPSPLIGQSNRLVSLPEHTNSLIHTGPLPAPFDPGETDTPDGNPKWRQIIDAALSSMCNPQTEPHVPLMFTSTRPSMFVPPCRRNVGLRTPVKLNNKGSYNSNSFKYSNMAVVAD